MKYDWTEAGEEWSAPWGSSAAQWFAAILPRIHDCLPTGTISSLTNSAREPLNKLIDLTNFL